MPKRSPVGLSDFKKIEEGDRVDVHEIFNYALLPENIRRPEHLIRPPGNKRDN